jgi:hypothetical protein
MSACSKRTILSALGAACGRPAMKVAGKIGGKVRGRTRPPTPSRRRPALDPKASLGLVATVLPLISSILNISPHAKEFRVERAGQEDTQPASDPEAFGY